MASRSIAFVFICVVSLCRVEADVANATKGDEDGIALLLKLIEQHRKLSNSSAAAEGTSRKDTQLRLDKLDPAASLNNCLATEFLCVAEDLCIQGNRQCDGVLDCHKGSDEIACFECKHDLPSGRLIPSTLVCDGVSDCIHGEDEHACKSPCANMEFPCQSNDMATTCIPSEWKCDSLPDCPDFSDESLELCGNRLEKCGPDQFTCRHMLFCVNWAWRCDGEDDCGDSSDEADCDVGNDDQRVLLGNKTAEIYVWEKWSEWSVCSSDCDGEQTRTRKCRFGDCFGTRDEIKPCGKNYPCMTEPVSGCGTRTRVFEEPTVRVVGGQDAQLHEWPWQVQIFRPGTTIPFCGGSLIKSEWVLTVAHCFYKKKFKAEEYFVALGRQHTSRRIADDDEQYIRVRNFIIHEGYRGPKKSHQYDIALLELQREVAVSLVANLVCLPSADVDWLNNGLRDELECFVTGFGVNQMGRRPSIMQEAKVLLIDDKTCRRPYVYGDLVADSMICAGHLQGRIDACQGDSGGPLVCQHPEDGRWYQVGITSWGKGCGLPNRPGVYTLVSSYYEWIERIVLS